RVLTPVSLRWGLKSQNGPTFVELGLFSAALQTMPRSESCRNQLGRPESVPTGMPSCRAAYPRVLPSRSQRTTGTRYLSGSWLNPGRGPVAGHQPNVGVGITR